MSESDRSYCSVLQPDGKIVVAGRVDPDVLIVRFLPDGSLDPEFGNEGSVLLDYRGNAEWVEAMTLQPDGRILVTGGEIYQQIGEIFVLRLQPNGMPDSTFGNAGWITTDIGPFEDFGEAVLVQPDKRILIAGHTSIGSNYSDFVLVRYQEDGTRDSDFGTNGVVITGFVADPQSEERAFDMVLQPDGKIILGGAFRYQSPFSIFALARYQPDGALDMSFGEDGLVSVDLAGDIYGESISHLALISNGQILAAGSTFNLANEIISEMVVTRFNPNGEQDLDYGQGGKFVFHPPGAMYASLSGLYLMGDDHILICGKEDIYGLIVRVLEDGTIDQSFDTSGYILFDQDGIKIDPNTIWIQPDSKIVLTGSSPSVNDDLDFAAVRLRTTMILTPTIEPVTCFGGMDGSIEISPEGGAPPYMYSLDGVNFQESAMFDDLPAGIYHITVKDANGLTVITGPLQIGSPPAPEYEINTTDQELEILVTEGGTPPYMYSIDGGDIFTGDHLFTGLVNDSIYAIVVKDALDCILIEDDVKIMTSAVFDVPPAQPLKITPNPSTGLIRIEAGESILQGTRLNLYDLSGRKVFSTTLEKTVNGPIEIEVPLSTNGCYLIQMRNRLYRGVGKVVIQR